ncbi:protein of unknown function [bacterium A37T11]|nr:protein of unknown function [bacterium A37T11]
MKKNALLCCAGLLITSLLPVHGQNVLSKKEKQQGWKLLFDGTTTNGWHTYQKDKAGSAWIVKDGALTFNPDAPQADHGDLVTNSEYENYDLQLEWKISPEGNSGIIFGIKEDPKFGQTYDTGIEMQVLDNIGASDNKLPNHLAGTLYDLIGSREVSKPKAVGEWNKARILKKNGEITLWLNGIQTAHVKIGSEEWNTLLNKSKFKTWPNFAKYPTGKISLQDHGHIVAYRDIKIKLL